MPLEIRDLGAGQKDILASPGDGLFLLDLHLHHAGRVLDDLVDVGAVAGADFTQDALADPDDAADNPVALFRGNEG